MSSFTRICRPNRNEGIKPSRIKRLVQLSEMPNSRETLEIRSNVRIVEANYHTVWHREARQNMNYKTAEDSGRFIFFPLPYRACLGAASDL